jgi:hypothetical protein
MTQKHLLFHLEHPFPGTEKQGYQPIKTEQTSTAENPAIMV